MPQAVAQQIEARWGVPYVEDYEITEAMAATRINPPWLGFQVTCKLIGLSRAPLQCDGIRPAAMVDAFAPQNVNFLAVVVKVSGQRVVVGTAT